MAAQEKAKQEQIKQSAHQNTSIAQTSTNATARMPPPPAFSEATTINAEEERQKMMRALSGIHDEPATFIKNKTTTSTMKKERKVVQQNFNPPPPPMNAHLPPPNMPPPPAFTSQSLPPPPPQFSPPPVNAPLPPPSMPPPAFTSQSLPPPPAFPSQSLPPPSMPPPSFNTIEDDIYSMPHHFQAPPPAAPSAPPTHDESLLDNFHGVTPMAPPPNFNYSAPGVSGSSGGGAQGMDDELFLEFDFDGNTMSAEERRKMMEEQRAIMDQIQKKSGGNKTSETFVGPMTDTQNFHSYANEGNSRSEIAPDMDFAGMDPAQLEEQRAIMEDIERRSGKNRTSDAFNSSQKIDSDSYHEVSYQEALQMESQMEEDRKLAEQLQQQMDGSSTQNASSGYPGSRTGKSSSTSNSNGDSSWWGSMKSSIGASTKKEDSKRNAKSDDNDRPGTLLGVVTGEEDVVGNASNEESESASKAKASKFTSLFYGSGGDESYEKDSTSFLAVPNVGDNSD